MNARAELTVEMFPAAWGDALIVRCVGRDQTTNILIDAGLATTYHQYLKPRLVKMGESDEDISLFIITHIDADHIEGAIAFLSENGPADTPAIVPVRNVWHNSYRHLPLSGRPPSVAETARVLAQIAPPTSDGPGDISARHGTMLAALLRKYGYAWNQAFGGGAVVVSTGAPSRISLGGVTLTLLSPLPIHLEALAKRWRRELLMLGVAHDAVDAAEFESAFEAILLGTLEDKEGEETTISSTSLQEPPDPSIFREDRSVTNGSSIAFLLESEGVTALFLGDSFPSVVGDQLRRISTGATYLDVDLVKVSHHGSKRNTSPELLAGLTARNFLISSNGQKHGHPDMEALLWIVSSQLGHGTMLHFNYQTPQASAISAQSFRDAYGHSVRIQTLDEPLMLTIRAP